MKTTTKEKFIFSVLTVLIITTVILLALRSKSINVSEIEYAERVGRNLTHLIGISVSREISDRNIAVIQQKSNSIIDGLEYVRQLVIRGGTDEILVIQSGENNSEGDTRYFSSDIIRDDILIGNVTVQLDIDSLVEGYGSEQRNLNDLLIFVSIIAALIIILIVNISIINPVESVTRLLIKNRPLDDRDKSIQVNIEELERDAHKFIEDRQKRENELIRAKTQLMAVLDTIGEGIITIDQNGIIVMANKTVEKMWSYPSSFLVGKDLRIIMPERHRENHHRGLKRYLETREARVLNTRIEIEGQREDNSEFPCELFIAETKVDDELYFTAAIRDITERKKIEKDLLDAKSNTEILLDKRTKELMDAQMTLIQAEKLETIGTLAAGVAHEVKNPLAIIRLGVDYLLKSKHQNEEDNDVLEDISNAIKRADSVIKELIDFSAARDLSMTSVNLNEIIEDSLSMVRLESEKENITIVSELDLDLNSIDGDKQKLQQVLINILMNAFQATGQGGIVKVTTKNMSKTEIDPDITSPMLLRNNLVELTIDDNGPGLSKDKLEMITKPFFTTKSAGKGTGLGLTVVENIISLHEGKINFSNLPDGGLRVQLFFNSN